MGSAKLVPQPAGLYPSEQQLPLSRTYHPLGFPVNLATNSGEVLEAAVESWGMWEARFTAEPVDLRVTVQEEGGLALEPEFRTREHLFSVVSDRHNYAVMDLDRLIGHAYVSRKTVADHAWFRWYFLDTMGMFLLSQRHVAAVHAACVAREGSGLLLAGESCAGKSTLAWACARAGWTYLGDDATWLLSGTRGREVLGRPYSARFRHDAPLLFPELSNYLSRVRPNGKLSIEVLTSEFPNIRTASRCEALALVFLDRSGRRQPSFERVPPAYAVDELLGPTPLYRPRLRRRHRTLIKRLLRQAPAWRMRYKSLEEGMDLLGELHRDLRA